MQGSLPAPRAPPGKHAKRILSRDQRPELRNPRAVWRAHARAKPLTVAAGWVVTRRCSEAKEEEEALEEWLEEEEEKRGGEAGDEEEDEEEWAGDT